MSVESLDKLEMEKPEVKQPAACSRNRCIIAGIVCLTCVFIVAVSVGVGVVYGLPPNPSANSTDSRANSTDLRARITQIFVDGVEFPNGSYAINASSLSLSPSLPMPSIANSTVLQQLGINVDPTNNILVVNRQTFIYIVVPLNSSAVGRRRRDASASSSAPGIGLRFGGSPVVRILPLELLPRGLGFILRGATSSGSVYQMPITSPSSMCSVSSGSQCATVTYQAYFINGRSASFPSVSSSLSAACGPQCQGKRGSCSQSCHVCGSQQVAGTDTPVSRRFNVGETAGTFKFVYETYYVKDRIRVFQEDQQIFDTECVGTNGEKSVNISYQSRSEVRVDVEPNCLGTTGTAWYFQLSCPDPCDSTSINQVKLMNGLDEVKQSSTVYIDEEANMPSLTATYCASNTSTTVSWTFSIASTGTNDAPCSGDATEVRSTGSRWDIVSTYQQQAQANGKAWVRGGMATLKWAVTGGQTGSLTFRILGSQPDQQAILNYINSNIAGNQRLWMLPYIAKHESTQAGVLIGPSNFDGNRNLGYPLRSADNGYGVFQLTVPAPSCQQIWSWKANCDEGRRRMLVMTQDAYDWMNSPTIVSGRPKGQRLQARDDTGANVTVPSHRTANCVFADGTDRIIEDAVAMKMFNSAPTNYCSWLNGSKRWSFNELNSQNFNYVERVCSLVPSLSLSSYTSYTSK